MLSDVNYSKLSQFLMAANLDQRQTCIMIADESQEIKQDLKNIDINNSCFKLNQHGDIVGALIVDRYSSGNNLIDEVWGPLTLPYNDLVRQHLFDCYLENKIAPAQPNFFFRPTDTWLFEQLKMMQADFTTENLWCKSLIDLPRNVVSGNVSFYQETIKADVANELNDIHNCVFHHPQRGMDTLLQSLSPYHFVCVLHEQNEIVSYAIVDIDQNGETAHLDFLGTQPKFLRQGGARKLVTAISNYLVARRVKRLSLVQNQKAAAAFSLYRGLGFQCIATNVGAMLKN
ncbi:GNAT family N-acetyltransferase [Leuconostoc falkenbergense]